MAWFPWGPEAFAVAAERDVPVLVSIGYSTCHWCHVMARESFSDPATAAAMNDGFVAIKVDREEHPEVDAAYLDAASAFTPHLGWPLTVFATPAGAVFYAGTYWPPEARPPLPAFRDVLAAVREAWEQRRAEVERTGADLRDALARAGATGEGTLPDAAALADAVRRIVAREDREYGGFAAGMSLESPKFPNVPVLRLLQHPSLVNDVPEAAPVAARSLAAMIAGELHDPVEGGFFRYATRRDWTVPHFERMLTDNAGLVEVALAAGDEDAARAAARFLVDVLQQPSGGFAAAQDSESVIDGRRNEGGYYARDAEGRAELEAPALDGKIVTGWNGAAIAALARAGAALGDPLLVSAARWAADAVLEANVDEEGMLRRASFDEILSAAPATLEDYGGLAGGLLALALATGEPAYAVRARELVDACLTADGVAVPGGGDPVLAGHGMSARGVPSDGATASGPSAFAAVALDLWRLGAGESYRAAAATVVAEAAEVALGAPLAHGALLSVALGLAASPRQLVVVGDPDSALAVAARGLPADVVAAVTEPQTRALAAAGFALFEGKTASASAPAVAYDCRAFTCRLPVTDPDALVAAFG